MNALLAYALLTVLGCVLWTKLRDYRVDREQNRAARRLRMEVNHDQQFCRLLEGIPESEDADD